MKVKVEVYSLANTVCRARLSRAREQVSMCQECQLSLSHHIVRISLSRSPLSKEIDAGAVLIKVYTRFSGRVN